MRILIISQYFSPEIGATQTRMHYFARALADKGHEVTVICEVPNHPAGIIRQEYRKRFFVKSDEDGFGVIRVWVFARPRKTFLNRILFYLSFLINGVLGGLMLARGKYDVIFATSPPLPVGLAGLILAVFKQSRFVLDIRDLWPLVAPSVGELRRGLLYKSAEILERLLYRKASAVTCVTRSFVKYVLSKGIPQDRVFFLPNGTIPELFNPQRQDPLLREKLGLNGKFLVTFCGTHGVAQGLPKILEAAKLLGGEQKIVFCFVGEGPVKAELLKKKETDKIENVIFLPQVPVTEVTRYINASDLLLVPLKADKVFDWFIPSKMFDFMACGKAVIVTVDGEAKRILDESGGGVYVPPEDPAALAEVVCELSRDTERLSQMGRRGRDYVLSHFIREVQANSLERIFFGLVRRASVGWHVP